MTLVVAPCDAKAARYAVEHWHYSRTLPVGKVVRYGAWEHGRFIGSVLYAWGSNHHLASQFGLDMVQVAELVRVALDIHEAPVSQIVAPTLRMLHRSNPGLRLVVSFADPFVEHHGGIYQAMNWLYLGRTVEQTHWVGSDGTILNRRAFTGRQFGKGNESRATLPAGARAVKMPGKHRYVYPLDRAMRRTLRDRCLPYPSKT